MPIEPSSTDLQRFRERDDRKSFVMVQLLRFGEAGRDRYLRYAGAAQPILTRIGAQVLYAGECTDPLLPAEGQSWDAIVLVRYPSRAAYVEMLADPAYQAIADLRREALREAALMPMDDWPGR
jgi:uncharacterized protein (DUF1330 family)